MKDEARDQIVMPIEQRLNKKISIVVQELTRMDSNCAYVYSCCWMSLFVKESFRIVLLCFNGNDDEQLHEMN